MNATLEPSLLVTCISNCDVYKSQIWTASVYYNVMATEESKKVEAIATATATATAPAPAPAPPPAAPAKTKVDAPDDVVQEKSVIPHPPPPEEKTPDLPVKKISGGSLDRDIALAKVDKEKRLSYIKAWEEGEKSKVENKAQKNLSAVASWENTKKAAIEAKLKKLEEQIAQKKADYAEKMKNKVALVHKEAEEKRAMVEARRGEEILKAEEMAAKYRATGHAPKKLLGCFGG